MIWTIRYLDQLLQVLIWVLVGLTVHEVGHAWLASRYGDKAAAQRVTLNPLSHVDWGALLVCLIAGFLAAKPVAVNVAQLGANARRRLALIAAAGPGANLLLAAVTALLLNRLDATDRAAIGPFLQAGLTINAVLAIFNLLPFPPLDGSRILNVILGGDGFFSPQVELNAARWLPAALIIDAFTLRLADTLVNGTVRWLVSWLLYFTNVRPPAG